MNSQWPKYLLLVLTNCTAPEREAEFNQWYHEMHVPDLLQTPGLVKAQRYRNVRPGLKQPGYLALYEIEAQDPYQVVDSIIAGDMERAKQGRMIDCLKVVYGGTFQRIDE